MRGGDHHDFRPARPGLKNQVCEIETPDGWKGLTICNVVPNMFRFIDASPRKAPPMTDTPCDSSLPARYTDGRFGPGNPGRRAGSRNQASRRVVMAILEHFERNREDILDRLGLAYTPAYAGLLARLLPRQVELAPSFVDEVSDDEIARML